MRPSSKDLSTAVAKEVFRELGVKGGFDHVSFPEKGTWRNDVLSFHDCQMTSIIIRRPETASFPIIALFGEDPLTGESICDLSDGTPAITVDDGVLRFQFDPFKMHLANLNEGFHNSRTSGLVQSVLIVYWTLPPYLKRGLRWFVRRIKTPNVRSLNDIGLLGVRSNVVIHLIEQHFLEEELMQKYRRDPIAVVTHDIDTHFCQTEGREVVSSIESDESVCATWFFVPRSVQYSLDKRGVHNLIEEGHEIGMHGIAHDGKLALDDPAKLVKQLREGKNILESAGAKVVSFRSPWALRSPLLLLTLASEGFIADSSYPDVDTLGMTGGREGVSYNRPFRPLIVKKKSLMEPSPFWEVPATGPQDVQMIEDLGLTGSDLLRVWNYKAEFCKDFGGVFVLHTHPVHIAKHLDQYVEVLRTLKKRGFRILRMDNLAQELQSSLPD